MPFNKSKLLWLHIRQSQDIARRYLITNGFDGALTMLGLMIGFYSSSESSIQVAISASMGAAIALFMSGISSAYLSETAERKKELQELEQALISDLGESDYGQASRYVPYFVALVNGLSPLLISMTIILPLWLAHHGMVFPISPFIVASIIAFINIFFLGLFLGKVSNTFWLWAGLKALVIAILTAGIILFLKSS